MQQATMIHQNTKHTIFKKGAVMAYPMAETWSIVFVWATLKRKGQIYQKTQRQVLQPYTTCMYNILFAVVHEMLLRFLWGDTTYSIRSPFLWG